MIRFIASFAGMHWCVIRARAQNVIQPEDAPDVNSSCAQTLCGGPGHAESKRVEENISYSPLVCRSDIESATVHGQGNTEHPQ